MSEEETDEKKEEEMPDTEYWELQLDKLQIMIDSANENGLFKDKPETYKTLISQIIEALEGLKGKPPKTLEARKTYSFVTSDLNQQINADDLGWWRFKYVYAGPAFVYLTVFLSAILVIWLLYWPTLSDFDLLWVPAAAFMWGAVGSILWGFWKLWEHACSRDMRKAWYNWYIALPLMGAILGGLIYLMLLSGLLAITGEIKVQSEFLPLLLCGLAGFSSKWAVAQLENLSAMIHIGK